MKFDTVLMVDWSGGNDRGPTPKKDSIFAGVARNGIAQEPVYLRNRQVAEGWITEFLRTEQAAGRKVLAGFDFAFGYPMGFGEVLTGSDDPFAVWDWFEAKIEDSPKSNNRFDVAGEINALFPGVGPFWGNALKRDVKRLPRKGSTREGHGLPEKRAAEEAAKGAFPVWQLSGAGAVGSQTIMGLPVLSRLRKTCGASVWPFEPLTADVALVEVWPSLIGKVVAATQPDDRVRDAHQVYTLARAVSAMPPDELETLLDVPATPEGSILGLGHEKLLMKAAVAPVQAPPLRNDCFALPPGVTWTPVPKALAHLRDNLSPVTGSETVPLHDGAGRILSQDVTALRAHPPAPNSAVDGYGFAGPAEAGEHVMTLLEGRSAAGHPYDGTVPAGHALRVLTGAVLPQGVDTVVLQEDVNVTDKCIAFRGPIRLGANARKAGEDMAADQVILRAGRLLTPADLATAAAAGVGELPVRTRLRVGILSTGDELLAPGSKATEGQIFDANRPMLCAIAAAWGYKVVDLGRAPDDRGQLRGILDRASASCDVIISSGGASAGDEDHMSSLLKNAGSLAMWRVAMKPGRPLAMGLWGKTPVLGLPGNPVAAMICALIFARPALQVLAGGTWSEPEGYMGRATFRKSKKAGRREYLRARISNGRVAIFPSEGSGRVSGLSWATGLVELDDSAREIRPGDSVRFVPFGSFGL
ncbi:molybdopterin-binding protein [Yoonia sediminilitoris]|uniref:Molybdopterin molybdenumtransferase n=1 Tax=Yoonia sediminilitoris TaxID=1286148 RepID=A0A2T6KID5_9RHOB|nr:gephyrin-like molybdotransferase Glp [Yoonia sediminilitoris]PUB15482.1 molybdopterin molybdotransferase [Yoonia sediminilitoris]RCW96092.1 molybdopterin molybdotransferase [Yoonia sediminilitoris]